MKSPLVVLVSSLVLSVSARLVQPPCMGVLKGEQCTGAEIKTSLANVDVLQSRGFVEENTQQFLKSMDDSDCDCIATLVNRFYSAEGLDVNNMNDLINATHTLCPSSGYGNKLQNLYNDQNAKVQAMKNPECASLIQNVEADAFALGKRENGEQIKPVDILIKSVKLFIKFKEVFDQNKEKCKEDWTTAFKSSYTALNSDMANYSIEMLKKIPEEKLATMIPAMIEKMSSRLEAQA